MSWELDDPPALLVPPLALASALYGGAIALRSAAYALELARAHEAPVPVISVGNLTVGGNGKTPLVLALLERLRAAGRRPAVVSRGYGAPEPPRAPLTVDASTSWRVAGDEPALIARRSGALVVVSPDRLRGAEEAARRGADLVVLDDGFQHRRLARALDLVLVDARAPFGNGHLLPWGSLREPRAALSRAHLLIAHRGDADDPVPLGELSAPVEVAVRPRGLRSLAGERLEPAALSGARVALAAAIARPARLTRTVERLGARVEAARFRPDHAPLDPAELAELARAVDRVIVTEKDAARLEPPYPPVWVLEIDLVVLAGADALGRALESACTR